MTRPACPAASRAADRSPHARVRTLARHGVDNVLLSKVAIRHPYTPIAPILSRLVCMLIGRPIRSVTLPSGATPVMLRHNSSNDRGHGELQISGARIVYRTRYRHGHRPGLVIAVDPAVAPAGFSADALPVGLD